MVFKIISTFSEVFFLNNLVLFYNHLCHLYHQPYKNIYVSPISFILSYIFESMVNMFCAFIYSIKTFFSFHSFIHVIWPYIYFFSTMAKNKSPFIINKFIHLFIYWVEFVWLKIELTVKPI